MQTAACLICRIIKLSSCVQSREHEPCRGHSFLVHVHRDAAPVIRDCGGTVLFQSYPDLRTVSCQMLIHGVVYDLIDKMI